MLAVAIGLTGCQAHKVAQKASPSPSASLSAGPSPTPTGSVAAPSPTATPPSPPAPVPPPAPPRVAVVGPSGAVFTGGNAPGLGSVQHVAPGVVLPVQAVQAGWARVLTPCEQAGWVRLGDTTTLSHAKVVLDPGHGGAGEPGAVGQGGLAEKEVNLDVARQVASLLQARGLDTVLTRTGDYMATIAFRVQVADALGAAAFVSIHHNAMPDGPRGGPGTETFYQYTSPSSKRLAGLLYEEGASALSAFPATWVGNTDAGARWRLNDRGGDYYGLLRLSDEHHLTAGLAEMAFITNPSEESLLGRADVRKAEAQAISRALVRFLTTRDPGSGFSIPHPRKEPAGGGGGRAGCVDPIGP